MNRSPQPKMINKGLIDSFSFAQLPHSVVISPSEVHIWSIRPSSLLSSITSLTDFLSTDEITTATGFKHLKQRSTYIIHRGFIRRVLALYSHCSPKELTFNHNSYGKLYLSPIIANTNTRPVFFNSSKSDDLIVLAVSPDYEVGIDIEQIKDTFDFTGITRYFSKEEQQQLALLKQTSITDMRNGFYLGWTSKEAFIKCISLGLSFPLKDFTVNLDPKVHAKLLSLTNVNYRVEDFYMEQLGIHTGFSTVLCLNKNIQHILA